MIRNTLGTILLAKMSDPRFDPLKVSITRVEVPEDLLTAKVFISIAGDDKRPGKTIAALRHAAGYLQEQMAKRMRLRHTPRLDFQIDTKYRKTLETLNIISQVAEELREKEQSRPDETDDSAAAAAGLNVTENRTIEG